MVRASLSMIVATLALTGCGAPEDPAQTAEAAATALNSVLPKDLGGGAIVSSASAEGPVLVLKTDNLVARNDAAGGEETTRAIKAFACRDPAYSSLISQGMSVRFDLTDTIGRKLPSLTLNNCT